MKGWFKLPLKLRQRWWRETDYGKLPASEALQTEIAQMTTHNVSVGASASATIGDKTETRTVHSTSDERTTNNVMRHEYRVLSDQEKAQMQAVKDMGLAFHEMIDKLGANRELSLAKTKIEEAVMWAVKSITK